MFLYYWKDAKASRGYGRTKWTGAWNLLRVEKIELDEEEHTLTLSFDDIQAGRGCDVTQKVLKCSDIDILILCKFYCCRMIDHLLVKDFN